MNYPPDRTSIAVACLLAAGIWLIGCDNGDSPPAPAGGSAPTAAGGGSPANGAGAKRPQTAEQPAADGSPQPHDNGQSEGQAATPGEEQPPVASNKAAAASGKPKEITFEDLLITVQQPDIVIRPWMFKDSTTQLDGQNIRIKGYMLADAQLKGIKEFILLRNTECKFGPGGQADHLIRVTLNEGQTAEFTNKPVAVEGVLTINPFQGPDGNTWSIYDMAGSKVSVERR